MTLREALGLKQGEMLSLVGAGGKTTTLFVLAHELRGGRVVVTTTTKIFKPAKPQVEKLCISRDLEALLGELGALRGPWTVAVGYGLDDTGKLVGLPPDWCETLRRRGNLDWLLIEADGAAMRPFKVPEEHEPVVPQECDLTVWVMGVKVLGKPMTPDWVHRAERAACLLEVEIGGSITVEHILRLVAHPQGCLKGIPARSRKVALINQADSSEDLKIATALGRELMRYGLERVVVTSYKEKEPVREVVT